MNEYAEKFYETKKGKKKTMALKDKHIVFFSQHYFFKISSTAYALDRISVIYISL